MRRGQALIEFALILPILLTLLLGGAVVGLVLYDQLRLDHAAIRGVDDGAEERGALRQCSVALATAKGVLARSATRSSCRVRGGYVELTLADDLPYRIPFIERAWTVSVTERANLR